MYDLVVERIVLGCIKSMKRDYTNICGRRSPILLTLPPLIQLVISLQNPNEDTQWNDVLRAKGIIPAKETELTEDDIVDLVEQTVEEKTHG